MFQTGDYADGLQATPIVVNGMMFLSTAQDEVFALDAANGAVLWHYKYDVKVHSGTAASRGVAVSDEYVYVGTWDSHLIAIDRRTGKETWSIALDVGNCFRCAVSGAPLLAKNLVITGESGGDTGYRGYITALDAHTGRLVWRFYVVPGPGEAGHESWKGDSWKTGGGAPWLTGSYDPELGLVYWTTGNPTPALSSGARNPDGIGRGEVSLYTSAVVALDVSSGKLRWHYSLVPNDMWDYDAVGEVVLFDQAIDGKRRRLLVQAGKSGVATVLDRTDGTYVRAFKFAEFVNWIDRISDRGEFIGRREPIPGQTIKLCPNAGGAKSWNQMAYSPRTNRIYVPMIEACADYSADLADGAATEGEIPGFGGSTKASMPSGRRSFGHIDSFTLESGQRVWKFAPGTFTEASVLATAGDLVFSGDVLGDFFALDANTGVRLWHFATGAGHRGSAISYAVNGRQFIATPTGMSSIRSGFLRRFATPGTEFRNGSTLVVFSLPEVH